MECFQAGSRDAGDAPGAAPVRLEDAELGKPLLCARCRHAITTTAARIEVAGSHEHVRKNEHGYEYLFGCFASAPGCQPVTWPTPEWTWFAGYTWEIGRCERCREHLGWRFASADHSFFGLIVDRLIEADDQSDI